MSGVRMRCGMCGARMRCGVCDFYMFRRFVCIVHMYRRALQKVASKKPRSQKVIQSMSFHTHSIGFSACVYAQYRKIVAVAGVYRYRGPSVCALPGRERRLQMKTMGLSAIQAYSQARHRMSALK